MSDRPGLLRRFFGGLWHLLDFSRRLVLNLFFLALVVVLAIAWFSSDRPPALKDRTALVLNLRGDLVEQYRGGGTEAALARALGQDVPETRLRDVLDSIDAAATDPQIARVVLVLDDLDAAGLAALREIGEALDRFRQEGKEVVAWGGGYNQRQFLLAAHADQVFLHPMGEVGLRGLGGYSAYFKDALDKLGIDVHVFHAGKFKSFGENYSRTGPTPEAREAEAYLLNGLWGTWLAEVESGRKLPPGTVTALIDNLPARLEAAGGDMARLALQAKLVDGLKTRDEFRALLIERGAPAEGANETFRQIGYLDYLRYLSEPDTRAAVGVIVAQGEIVDDGPIQGAVVSAKGMAELIARARDDKDVRAIVLRVDSPGGSPFASEVIRRELELARQAGKPVVVSMANVAASGGYWISMAADEVVADATTITGSIGVVGMLPTFDKALDKLGIATAGEGTTWLAGASDPRRPLDPRFAQLLQLRIGENYRRFLDVVAQGRKSTPEKINEVAQGRVWTGEQARERGLVDTLGGLGTALDSAATRAKLGDDYRVVYIEPELRGLDRWIALLGGSVIRAADRHFNLSAQLIDRRTQRAVERALRPLSQARDNPESAWAHCFCVAP